jgi:hypothetical protein
MYQKYASGILKKKYSNYIINTQIAIHKKFSKNYLLHHSTLNISTKNALIKDLIIANKIYMIVITN